MVWRRAHVRLELRPVRLRNRTRLEAAPSPPGWEWQRAADWKKEMLPEDSRPMLLGEIGRYEFLHDGLWLDGHAVDLPAANHQSLRRTSNPLPPYTISAEQVDQMFEAATPLMRWIYENCPPRTQVIVDRVRAELWESTATRITDAFRVTDS